MKKALKRIGIVVIILLIAVGAYVAYVFGTYYRLPDKLTLEVKRNGENSYFDNNQDITTGKFYWIMTYNIGFGAYRRDYSFFMDGGKSSWAKDEESVIAGICGMGEIINNVNPDFVLLQEVDIDGTRSYHVDQLELMNQFVKGYYYTYAQDYDSPFLFFPPWEPHGANEAGIVTYSRNKITDAMRRSLPISESFSKLVDLDRCYSISRIPMDNNKYLCIYNIHMSAYGSSDAIREGQLAMLFGDMETDFKNGNYVICGGDFNHNLKADNDENAPDWAFPFPKESLPDGFRMAIDGAREEDIAHNSCRNANEPYNEETTYTVTLDGFIVSDNVTVNYYANMNWGYELSDHDPVIMQFRLD
ncbi:MAG: endonuclease/exonuclease/phosphatase family protein [Lachnospiraceae bacterium]|nr:endonuclease/exonuclease/phosphatase family protein [Lachnospiraceae bacterium]MBD5455619.1 endonuclease/exonuclease/phosphatase family protein [Lachnospiraceae bacterium]